MKAAFPAIALLTVLCMATPGCADAAQGGEDTPGPYQPDSPAGAPQALDLSAADHDAAFAAAGFHRVNGQWRSGCEDPGTPSYSPGTLDKVADLNGDGLAEAVIVEGGTYCYGMAGQGYFLVGKQAGGGWKLIDSGIGFANFLASKGTGGWPDIEVGGPGFCFPVLRWNGSEYALHRKEYEGKPCSA